MSKPVFNPRAAGSRWYIVHTGPKLEERARRSLSRAGFGTYLPMVRIERQHRRTKQWTETILPLFQRHLFVCLPDNPAGEYWGRQTPSWLTLRGCDGVTGVLGVTNPDGEQEPFPVAARVVERLMAHQLNLEFDDTRDARIRRRELGRNERETTAMRFPVGSRVRAKDGPFMAFRGLVTGVTAHGEVEAVLELMGRLTPVTFPVDHLDPALEAAA